MQRSRTLFRRWAFGSLALSLIGGSILLQAAPPSWWTDGNPPVIDPQAESNNHGVANVGQAKNMAKEAIAALSAVQPDAAHAIEQELVGEGKPLSSWDSPSTEEQRLQQYQPLLIGQLKAISAPFYSKLHEIAPEWLQQQLTENQTKDASDPQNYFPWTSDVSDDSNKSPATIGQLKAVFSLRFDSLAVLDSDGDGLPDTWEIEHGLDPNDNGTTNAANGPDGDADGDGVSNADELAGDSDPNNAADFPVRVISVAKVASGDSNTDPHPPPLDPYFSYIYTGPWWVKDGVTSSVVWDSAATPTYLASLLDGIAFPATPPTPPADRKDLVPQYNLSGGILTCDSFARQGDGGIDTKLTAGRIWIKAPAAPAIRKFTLLRVKEVVTYDYETETESTSVSSEIVIAEIPANQILSNPIDAQPVPTAVENGVVNVYETLSIPQLLDAQEDESTHARFIETLPPRGPDESQNDYIQRPLPDRHVAFIEPHRGANNSPDMPRLVARLSGSGPKGPGGSEGVKVKWRLEVDYERGNGWRAPYILDWHSPEDRVRIPAAAQDGTPRFTEEMDANETWRIFETQDWQNEIQQRGFFGGTAKLYFWLTSQPMPTEPVITFRIGGKNPNPAIAKTFIQSHLCDNRLWFAYAIAKKESPNYDKPFYNQFFGSTRKASPLDENGNQVFSSGFDENKDWQCWAKAWPVFNIDRESRNGPLNSAGGYGIFQVTGDAQSQWTIIPRRQIWNWQDNVGYQNNNVWHGAMGILKAKIQMVDARYNALQQTYPSCGAIPNYPLNTTATRKRFSGWDAYTCKGYNGFGGTGDKITINGFKSKQWSVWHPHGDHWQFIDDGYTFGVWSNIEENN